MFSKTIHRIVSLVACVVILVTALASVAPVFADSGTADYVVKGSDNLTKIARRYGLTVDQILTVNPQIKDANTIRTGSVITLPAGRSEGVVVVPQGRFMRASIEKNGGEVRGEDRFYLVKGGDNLSKIATAYGISLQKLLDVNPQIDNANIIYGGELVRVPVGVAEKVPSFYTTNQ